MLEPDVWYRAEVKDVTDGTSTSVYRSGFNVLRNEADAVKYLERFDQTKRILKVVPVCVNASLRPKSHSRSDVWLADYLMIEQTVKPKLFSTSCPACSAKLKAYVRPNERASGGLAVELCHELGCFTASTSLVSFTCPYCENIVAWNQGDWTWSYL